MRRIFIPLVFFIGSIQLVFSQEDGVTSFTLPIRNSLKFNKYVINPSFSFVREQNPYISLYKKWQWVQFDNAPETYLVSYSGRLGENEGIAVGLFQHNYDGLRTAFGVIGNFAHNIMLEEDSNLTFGVNLGFYKNGLNKSKVVTSSSSPDLSVENYPSNSLLSLNPGINYGTSFLDFGLSVNNMVLYNINTSTMVKDDPERSIEGHVMYTGYLDSYGFFDRSKFSGLLKTELKKEKTIVSGLMMFAIPKGIWAQAGYNSLYGMSAGIGMNITPRISFEYNFEKETGSLSKFGSSHEIVLAYKFKSRNYYYDDEDNEGAIIPSNDNGREVYSKPKDNGLSQAKLAAEAKAKADAAAQAKLAADAKAKADAELKAKLAADAKAKADADAAAKLVADAKAKADAELKAKLAADAKAKADAALQAKPNADAATKAKLAADAKAKADAIAKAKLAADAKAKADAEAATKLAAEQKAKADAAAKAKLAADAKAKADAELKAKLAADAKAKADAEAAAKLVADAKGKADAELKAKLAADAKAKADAEAATKLAAEQKAKADAELKAKLAADAKAKADAEAAAKLAADAKAKADAEAAAKLAAEAKAKADADAKAKAVAEKAALLAATKDENARSMDNLARVLVDSKRKQQELLAQLDEKVANKEKDLRDLKEENDLSEKGIFKEPKAFKSVSAENSALESLKIQITEVIASQNEKIRELDDLFSKRVKKVSNMNDELNQYYLKSIEKLKVDQLQAIQSNTDLLASLEKIKTETEIEKKRRIKRAAFENDQGRYLKDVAALKHIKETTAVSKVPLKPEDFDYGEDQTNNQILKNIKNAEGGYYLIVAVHKEVEKRDAFVTKAVAAGQSNINFFFDISTGKYFIYYDKFDTIEEAQNALQSKGNKPFNGKMTMAKIEKE